MVDTVAKYLNLPMQTGPGIDIPETPGHEHPHPVGRGMRGRASRRSAGPHPSGTGAAHARTAEARPSTPS
jgi:hypothetical protein